MGGSAAGDWSWNRHKFVYSFTFVEAILLLLYFTGTKFAEFQGGQTQQQTLVGASNSTASLATALQQGVFNRGCNPLSDTAYGDVSQATDCDMGKYYPMFQDVHVMIFIGFGFLMTFLKKYGYSSVALTLLVGAVSIQWGILLVNMGHILISGEEIHKIALSVSSLIQGDFAAGAVLISMGACLGKLTPAQLLAMAILELVFYSLNEAIGAGVIEAIDMGGSMFVHTFGAYFGLMVSYMVTDHEKLARDKRHEGATKNSDMFAMIGSIFLWMYWPSFNGALASGPAGLQHRVIINTVIALTGSCVVAFLASKWFRPGAKFNMVDIQNATLAGGVAVGSSSDLVAQPGGALLVGMVGGFVSVWGYVKLQGALERSKLKLHDTCGVHNLHGLPGILGGVSGALSAGFTSADIAGGFAQIGAVFPARGPPKYASATTQMFLQLAALGVTLLFSIGGGLIVGYILKGMANPKQYFVDEEWELEEEDEETGLLHKLPGSNYRPASPQPPSMPSPGVGSLPSLSESQSTPALGGGSMDGTIIVD